MSLYKTIVRKHRRWTVVAIIAILATLGAASVLAVKCRVPVQSSPNNKTHYVVLTFDTEEDWDPNTHCFYNSYKYVDSGAFYRLVSKLAERNISATFYVTPNLARDRSWTLIYLKDKGQTVGVHLHPHTLVDVDYPYEWPYTQTNEEITSYCYSDKLSLMERAKDIVEEAVDSDVGLYRSGMLSCNYEIEEIARDLGYKAISNYTGTRFIDPPGIWNLSVADWDIFDSGVFSNVDGCMEHYRSVSGREDVVALMGHPMRLYDLNQNKINGKEMDLFFTFIDELIQEPNVEFINQYQLLEMVQKQQGQEQ